MTEDKQPRPKLSLPEVASDTSARTDARLQTGVWSAEEVNRQQQKLIDEGLIPGTHTPEDKLGAHSVQPLGRKRARWPFVIAAMLAFILIGGGLAHFIITADAENRENARKEGYAILDQAIALISEADKVIIAIDKSVEESVTSGTLSQLDALTDQVAGTRETLRQAAEKARQANNLFANAEDNELGQHVINAADYRNEMLSFGKALIQYDIDALKSALILEEAWALIVGANDEMREAVEIVGGVNTNKVKDAVELNKGALDKVKQAQIKIQEAEEALEEADFSTIINYLIAKEAAIQLAIESDEALLAEDLDLAKQKNDEYTSKDTEAVELAAMIPTEPMDLIVSAYEAATEELRDSYHSVRASAADADAFIRVYVGVDTQGEVSETDNQIIPADES